MMQRKEKDLVVVFKNKELIDDPCRTILLLKSQLQRSSVINKMLFKNKSKSARKKFCRKTIIESKWIPKKLKNKVKLF
jgi:hypothetical protein